MMWKIAPPNEEATFSLKTHSVMTTDMSSKELERKIPMAPPRPGKRATSREGL